ncbi:MAG: AAA family ATPase [Bacteriovorax sp.]|nr:AAA family ATPase [Bacteriovorax sp.]
MNTTPQVIIINGNSCTGKSYLLHKLTQKLDLPNVSRDEFKEMLFEQMGIGDAEWSKKLGGMSYSLFFMTIEKLLKTKKSFIIENNFNPKIHSQALKSLLEKFDYESMEIFLEADPAVILNRHKKRWESGERHRGHADNERFEEFEMKLKEEVAVPLNVSERIIRIDTSDFTKVNYDEILGSL